MLREHNIETYEKLCETMEQYNNALIVQTTGTGKSYLALEYIEENELLALVVVPTNFIGEQWCTLSKNIEYVCYPTFVKMTEFYNYDIVIFDEAHHIGAPTYKQAMLNFINLDIPYIGLTADSVRWSDSETDVAELFWNNSVVLGYNLQDALADGILPEIDYTIAIYDTGTFSRYFDNKKITESLLSRLQFSIDNCESIKSILLSKLSNIKVKGILFVDSINNVVEATRLLKDIFGDIMILPIHSDQSNYCNAKCKKMFDDADSAFIIAVNMFNEGLHVDGVNTIIMLRRTGSPTVYFQQIGRAMSIDMKDTVYIFDLVGNKNILHSSTSFCNYKTNVHTKLEILVSDQVIVDDKTEDITNVLREIELYLGSRHEWTYDELNKLKSDYAINGSNIKLLIDNGITRREIHCKARSLGLRYLNNHRWKTEYDGILKSEFPVYGDKCPTLMNLGFYHGTIRRHAKLLGLVKEIKAWESWEDEKIKSDYPENGSKIPELIANGRTREAIKRRARMLGVTTSSLPDRHDWTDDAIQILYEEYPLYGRYSPTLIAMGFTDGAIATKAKTLKIKFTGPVSTKSKWTEEVEQILYDEWPIYNKKCPTLIAMGFSESSIKTHAQKIGLAKESMLEDIASKMTGESEDEKSN